MSLALQAALLLIIGWLPGAALFRVPAFDRHRRASLDAEERTFWSVILSVAVSLSLCLALAAAGQYSVERLLVADLSVAAAVAVIWRGRLRLADAKRAGATTLVPILLLGLGVWRFFPPSEYVIGGKDPGVYVNEGIQIAQRGALVIHDATVAAVPSFARDLFLPRHLDLEGDTRVDYYSIRFMGFFIKDPDAGTVIGQFPHLFPASIAIGYGIDGVTGARRTSGVWALLGLMAVYFAGARLVGKPAAAIAAGLLTLHVITVWFSRYPNAEVVMQAMVFAALLANARAHVDQDPFFAPVAGGLLGLLLFLRLDSLLAIAAVGSALALQLAAGQRVRGWFVTAFALPAAVAVLYIAGPMRAYAYTYFLFFQRIYLYAPWWQYVLAAMAVAGALIAVGIARRQPAFGRRIVTLTPLILGGGLLVGAVYGLFLRHPGGALAAHDAYALRTFANVYFTVPGVLAAALGCALLARDRFWRDPALFVTIAVFAFSVFYKPRIIAEHFWMARRFLPVILPGALLFISAAVCATAPQTWSARLVRWTLGGAFIVLLAGSYVRATAPVLAHIEYEGLIRNLEQLADRFTSEDLIIAESRDAGGDVHVLATPLAYIYARNVLLLHSPRPDKSALDRFVEWARTRYRRVFFLGGAGTDLLSHDYSLRPVAAQRFAVPEFETTTDARPRNVTRKDVEFGLYEFVDPRPQEDGEPFDLDVGGTDDLHVLRFHARETADGRTFRWTGAQSFVSVTTVPGRATELTLVVGDGGRPPAAPPARLDVYFHNQHLVTLEVEPGGFKPYPIRIPADLVARAAAAKNPVELRLVVEPWNPHHVLGVPDDRELGVMLDRVTVK